MGGWGGLANRLGQAAEGLEGYHVLSRAADKERWGNMSRH